MFWLVRRAFISWAWSPLNGKTAWKPSVSTDIGNQHWLEMQAVLCQWLLWLASVKKASPTEILLSKLIEWKTVCAALQCSSIDQRQLLNWTLQESPTVQAPATGLPRKSRLRSFESAKQQVILAYMTLICDIEDKIMTYDIWIESNIWHTELLLHPQTFLERILSAHFLRPVKPEAIDSKRRIIFHSAQQQDCIYIISNT